MVEIDHISRLLNDHLKVGENQLILDGTPSTELAERYSTPVYVYCPAIFRERLKLLRQALPDFEVYFSFKANPTPAVIRVFLEEGCGLEIGSGGELIAALRCGCPASKIVFSGPAKSDMDLEAAVKCGVKEIHVESINEIYRLGEVAAKNKSKANVAIRVNPSGVVSGGRVILEGKPTPFGVDEEVLEETARKIEKIESLNLNGLHVYVAAQFLDHSILLSLYEHILEIAANLALIIGRDLDTVNFGSGLGIPYNSTQNALDIKEFGRLMSSKVQEARKSAGLGATQLLIEPGRILAGEGGIYLTRVVDCKVSRGERFVVLDGGLNHHLAATGNLGQVIKRNYPIAVANRMDCEEAVPVNLVGPLCTPLDTFGRNVMLPPVEVGDLIAVFQSGAYGRSTSPLGFLSNPTPPEVFAEGGKTWIIRERLGSESFLWGTDLEPTGLRGAAKG
jgi:diaminopimelate decarboxylase